MSKYRIAKTETNIIVQGRYINPFFIFDSNIGLIKVISSYIFWVKVLSYKDRLTEGRALSYIAKLYESENILLEDIKSCLQGDKIEQVREIKNDLKDKK